jgi:hypothetical protein
MRTGCILGIRLTFESRRLRGQSPPFTFSLQLSTLSHQLSALQLHPPATKADCSLQISPTSSYQPRSGGTGKPGT